MRSQNRSRNHFAGRADGNRRELLNQRRSRHSENGSAVENPTDEISLPVLIALRIAHQETVAIGLFVDVSPAKDRTVPELSVAEKMRTSRIVALSAASIISAGEQAIFIASLVGARAIGIVVIVAGFVDSSVVVDRVASVARAISIVMLVQLTVTILVLILVFISVAITVLIAVLVFVTILPLIPIPIFVAAPTLVAVHTAALGIGNDHAIALSLLIQCATRTPVVAPI